MAAHQVIALRRSWRTTALVFAVLWSIAGAGVLVMFATLGAWPLVVIGGLGVLAVLWVAVRATRVRLVITPDVLVVANLVHTTRVSRRDVRSVDVGPSSNPLGELRTVVIETVSGDEVRVEAVASSGGDGDLDDVLGRLDSWLRRRG